MDGLFSEMSHFAWREAMLSYMRRRWRGAGRLRAASFSGRAPPAAFHEKSESTNNDQSVRVHSASTRRGREGRLADEARDAHHHRTGADAGGVYELVLRGRRSGSARTGIAHARFWPQWLASRLPSVTRSRTSGASL